MKKINIRNRKHENDVKMKKRTIVHEARPDAPADRKPGGSVTGDWPAQRPPEVDVFNVIRQFHDKLGLPRDRLPETVERGGPPRLLTPTEFEYRWQFMCEEMAEFNEAHQNGDIAHAAGELLDLVWVAIGTIYWMRAEPECLWAEIERANMSKRRAKGDEKATGNRGKHEVVVKPKDFVSPRLGEALAKMRKLWYGPSELDKGAKK